MTTTSATEDFRRDLSRTLWPDLSLVGVAFIWGINIPIMKIGLEHIDVYVFNAIRLVISSIVLVTFAVAERRRGILPKPGIPWWQLVVYSALISAIYQVLFLLGVANTTSGNTALIIATIPMWTALLARFFIGEHLKRLAWLGLIISLIGTVVVAFQKGDVTAGLQHLLGNLLVLGSAVTWSIATVCSRPLLKKISPLQLSASAAVIALPVHLLLSISQFENNVAAVNSPKLWLIIFYSGVLSSGLALPMWNFGVRHAGAAHAAIAQNLIPMIAIIAAWLSRGEPISAPQIFGGALILGGLMTMRLTR